MYLNTVLKYIKKYLNTEVFKCILWIVLNTVKYMGLGGLNISESLPVDPAVAVVLSYLGCF